MRMKIISVAITVFVALLIVSVGITLPILFRPFYYAQIEALGLPQDTGLTFSDIKFAYDEMMDYCLGLRPDFSAGILPFSESGASHFDDVRTLFFVDFAIIGICAISLVIITIVLKKKRLSPHRFLGRSAPFWSVVSIASISAVIGIACAIDFHAAFVFFHKIFFVGKTNWAFDPKTDPIIELLPNQFFSNCAVLIFAIILLSSVSILIYEFLPRKKNK